MSKRSPLFVIFTTVLFDLIGFGMVIPLVSLYGAHFGASTAELAILGAAYSIMQFIFAPFWGSLSDRIGRRPVLLISLMGSTISYLVFGLATTYSWLLISRAFGGIFAANISAAQAYIADITTEKDRAKGMGLIGAAFGIGFTLGPPIGGILSKYLGLGAPGLFASAICGLNFLIAFFRLSESLPSELRVKRNTTLSPINPEGLKIALHHPYLLDLLLIFFFATFAFANMESVFSLFLQRRFLFSTEDAGFKTGMLLMCVSIIGAVIQGGLIKRIVDRFGEWKVLSAGVICNVVALLIFPLAGAYSYLYIIALPLAIGSSLINPSLAALTSKSVDATQQGAVFGLNQGLASLARAVGPLVGLFVLHINLGFPFYLGSLISLLLYFFAKSTHRKYDLATKP